MAERRRIFRGEDRAGFSMVELLVAFVIAVIALLSLLSSIVAGKDLHDRTDDYGLSSRAVQRIHETLRNGSLDVLVAQYKAASTFSLDGVDVEMTFPEQVLLEATGMDAIPNGWRYRDLDRDGEVELDPGASATTSLVPVTVIVRSEEGIMRSSFIITER